MSSDTNWQHLIPLIMTIEQSIRAYSSTLKSISADGKCIVPLFISSTISLFTRLFTSPILFRYPTSFGCGCFMECISSTLRTHWSISSQHNSSGTSSLRQDFHVGGRFPFREKKTISHDRLQLQIQEKAFVPWEDQDFEPAEHTNPRCEVDICLLVCLEL